MVLLLFKQRQSIRLLVDMLKSRGLLTDDDEDAFCSAIMQDQTLNAALFAEAKRDYLELCSAAGIQTGLEQMPEPPLEWFRPPTK